MEKILYLIANAKPEHLSASRTVSRALVNRLMELEPDYALEELDLYRETVPRPRAAYFSSRSCVVSGGEEGTLPLEQQAEVRKMEGLCSQFLSATVIVLAAPMWSLSFPGVVKDYLDCVIQKDKTIAFRRGKPVGLLDDRQRTFLYVQSSGGSIPWALRPVMNKGLGYVEDMMKFIGIRNVDALLVDDTGTTEQEGRRAVAEAIGKIDNLLEAVHLKQEAVRTGW